MLRILPNQQIDKQRWDACLDDSTLPLPYCYSWYLDIACPGWDAIVDEQYKVIAPLPNRIKAGVKYVYQPFFTQQFGLFVKQTVDLDIKITQQEFLSMLNTYALFIHLQLHFQHEAPTTFDKVLARTTHLINLKQSYDQIVSNYSENLKRNLKKHSSNCIVKINSSSDNLIQLFRDSKADEVKELKQENYKVLSELVHAATQNNNGMVWEVWMNDQCVAASFILYNESYVVNLFNASNSDGRKYQAMSILLNEVIKHFSNSNRTFDFEGSDLPGVAAFYQTFGSQPHTYWHIMLNQLPWHLRILKNIKDGLQHR